MLTSTYGVDIMHVYVIILDIVNECNPSILGAGDPRKAEAAKELKRVSSIACPVEVSDLPQRRLP